MKLAATMGLCLIAVIAVPADAQDAPAGNTSPSTSTQTPEEPGAVAEPATAPAPTAAGAAPASASAAGWQPMPMASEGSDPRLERRLSQQGRPSDDKRNRSKGHVGPVGTLYVGVPLVLNIDGHSVNRDEVRPGGSVDFRGGTDFGWFTPEFELGYMGIPLRPSAAGIPDGPARHFYFGFGARLQLPNSSPVTPYVSGAFDFQFWNFLETQIVCSAWYCWEQRSYDFTPGLSGRAGLSVDLSARAALDVGLRVGVAFPGGSDLPGKLNWVQPAVGITMRH